MSAAGVEAAALLLLGGEICDVLEECLDNVAALRAARNRRQLEAPLTIAEMRPQEAESPDEQLARSVVAEQRRREVELEADWQSRIDWSAFEPQAETRAAAALTAAARAQGRTAAIRLISGDRQGLARSHFEAEARGEGRLPPEPLEPEARR